MLILVRKTKAKCLFTVIQTIFSFYLTQQKISSLSSAPPGLEEKLAQMEKNQFNVQAANEYNMQHAPDNVEVTNRHPISIG